MIFTTFIYFLKLKAFGWVLFTALGSLSNLFYLYITDLPKLMVYKKYVTDVLLNCPINSNKPLISLLKNGLRIYLWVSIFLPFRLIQLGSSKIYFGLSLMASLSLFSGNPVLFFFGLTFVQFWTLHVLIVFSYKKQYIRSFIFWLYSFTDDTEVDFFFLQLISNPFKQLASNTFRGVAALTVGYGLNLGEVHYAEYVSTNNLNAALANCKTPPTVQELMDIKAQERLRVYNSLPIQSAKISTDAFISSLDVTIKKREK